MSFGIVLDRPKCVDNVASTLRTARCYETAFVAIVGNRAGAKAATGHPMNAHKTDRHIPVMAFPDWDAYFAALSPSSWPAIGIEVDGSTSLPAFRGHARSAVYLFGPEDGSLAKDARRRCVETVSVPTMLCLNLAITVATVCYDRAAKRAASEKP